MKIYSNILLMMSALLLTACGGKEDEPQVVKQPVAIAFTATTAVMRQEGITRTVGMIDDAALQSSGFGVFAAQHGTHPYDSSSVQADYMCNQRVYYDIDTEVWTYLPLKYWPTGDGEHDEYVTFFAYAPYSLAGGTDNASKCITDFSGNDEQGDPWLTYQLGGTTTDWQSSQVDLLYAFTKDQCQNGPYARVPFTFRHALATAGDEVTLLCTDLLQTRMKAHARTNGKELKLIIDRLTLTYSLVPKARLVLNSGDSPNWQAINSGDATVSRVIAIEPDGGFQVARATSGGTYAEVTGTAFATEQGIFYIPIDVDGVEQTVTVGMDYRVTLGGTDSYSGSLESTVALTGQGMAGHSQDIRITLGDNLPLFDTP